MGRLVQATIVLFWLVMTGLLVRREILPSLWLEAAPSYEALLSRRLTQEETRTAIFLEGRRVGHAKTTITPEADGTYKISGETRLEHGGTPLDGWTIESQSTVDFQYRLKSTEVVIKSPVVNARLKGLVQGTQIELTTSIGGMEPRHETIPYASHGTMSNGLSPFISMPHLSVGKEWDIEVVNPLTLQIQTTRARVTELEEIDWAGRRVECFVVVAKNGPSESRAWIDKEGRILQEEPMRGLRMVREE